MIAEPPVSGTKRGLKRPHEVQARPHQDRPLAAEEHACLRGRNRELSSPGEPARVAEEREHWAQVTLSNVFNRNGVLGRS